MIFPLCVRGLHRDSLTQPDRAPNQTLFPAIFNPNLMHLLKIPKTPNVPLRSLRPFTSHDPHAVGPTFTDLLTPVAFRILAFYVTLPQVGNLTEVLIPYAKYRMRVRAEERSRIEGTAGKVQRTQAEKGLYLEQYDREFGLWRQTPSRNAYAPEPSRRRLFLSFLCACSPLDVVPSCIPVHCQPLASGQCHCAERVLFMVLGTVRCAGTSLQVSGLYV